MLKRTMVLIGLNSYCVGTMTWKLVNWSERTSSEISTTKITNTFMVRPRRCNYNAGSFLSDHFSWSNLPWIFPGRNRWVEYNPKHNLEYDGSMVPAEWFGWLHYKTDLPPTVKPPPQYKWIVDHDMNKTGTPDAYVPFSTTLPKIQPWVPPKKQ